MLPRLVSVWGDVVLVGPRTIVTERSVSGVEYPTVVRPWGSRQILFLGVPTVRDREDGGPV